jgi:hypothetical protein
MEGEVEQGNKLFVGLNDDWTDYDYDYILYKHLQFNLRTRVRQNIGD